jgi:DNA anti-recombination protein RmuC
VLTKEGANGKISNVAGAIKQKQQKLKKLKKLLTNRKSYGNLIKLLR